MNFARRLRVPAHRLFANPRLVQTGTYHTNHAQDKRSNSNSKSLFAAITAGAVIALAASKFYADDNKAKTKESKKDEASKEDDKHEEHEDEEEILPGKWQDGLKEYTTEEVANHRSKETGFWVCFREGVYDITEFLEEHPGGLEKISLAIGKSIEPFWSIYNVHHKTDIYKILEGMRIGNLKLTAEEKERKSQKSNSDDPYASDPARNPLLIVNSDKPFNAEVPTALLADEFITPTPIFFIRNHLPVPLIDKEKYVLIVQPCEDCEEKKYTFDDLVNGKFEKHDVVATIQCAGNRRNELNTVKPVKGLSWTGSAISNAKWTGVSLKDVLIDAGFDPEKHKNVHHIQFDGYDTDGTGTFYGTSVPIEKVLLPNGDTILAFKMNDKKLPLDHGFPIRVVVPGHAGTRSVKWLRSVRATESESASHWQAKDYKSFSPAVDWDTVDWDSAPAIQELPVQSLISFPPQGSVLSKDVDEVELKGYAWSGGGHRIIRVDITVDDGATWHTAELEQEPAKPFRNWAWSLWRVTVPIPSSVRGEFEVSCRAVDDAYNVQPESAKNLWNLRGLVNNAWHRVKIYKE